MTNRLKKSIFILLFIFLGLSLIGCKDNGDNGGDVPTPPEETGLKLIGLDLSIESVNFDLGEELNISDLKVLAHYEDNTTEDVTSTCEIDASRYNKDKDGTYPIVVSYSKNNKIVENFLFAVVGTGISVDDGSNDEGKNFGPGTYELYAAVALQNLDKGQEVLENSSYADGFFRIKGKGSKRANSDTFAFELPKEENAWIEFEVTGTAIVTVVVSSTGGSNHSAFAIFDSENSVIDNNESITIVEGTAETTLTYTLLTGKYRILSQAGTTHSTRGVRVYSVKVVQE